MFSADKLPLALPSLRARSASSRYATATFLTLLAAIATMLIWPLINPAASLLFFIAVLVSAWYAGLRPGLLCAVLSTVACNFFLIAPQEKLHLGADDLLRLAVFMMAAVFVSSLTLSRQMAEAAKAEAQKLLEITYKSVGHAVVTTDVRGRVVSMNSVAESLTGWNNQEARGRRLEDIFQIVDTDPLDSAEQRIVSRVVAQNAVIALGNNVLIRTRDGTEIPVVEIATPIRNAEGKIKNIVLVLRTNAAEKTSARRIEDVLKDRLALLEAVDAKLYAVGLDGTCLFINARAAAMLGYRSDELIGKSFHDLLHFCLYDGAPLSWESCPAYAVMHGDAQYSRSKQLLRTREGNSLSVEFSATPIVIDDQRVGAVVRISECTAHERAQEALNKLETIVAALDEAVISHTLDGVITSWNKSAERIYGYIEDEVVGRHISIIHPPGRACELTEMFERARAGCSTTFETLRIGKGGTRLQMAITAAPVSDANGNVISISQLARYLGEVGCEIPESTNIGARKKSAKFTETALADRHSTFSPAQLAAKSARREVVIDQTADYTHRRSVRLVGKSPAMVKLVSTMERIAQTDSSVLITGATGTGKELVARYIHEHSTRAHGPFVDINCSAIPETLIEAELFGHQRGTFTGAHENRAGLLETASGGTLFLDEVDALNLSAQAKLLRAIQERRIRRVGGRSNVNIDVRIVSATNSDLSNAISEGHFRADLFYRLRVVPLRVPELCQRDGDIALLIDHFLKRYAERYGVALRRFRPEAQRVLLDYPWPGNVRELENAIEYALALSIEGELGIEHLPSEVTNDPPEPTAQELSDVLECYINGSVSLAEIEKRYILSVLQHFGGNQVRAAAALGIDRSKLYRRLKQYGVRAVKFLQDENQDGLQLLAPKNGSGAAESTHHVR